MEGLIRRLWGCVVINPARRPLGMECGWYMERSLEDVARCSALVLLRGWWLSEGARREWEAAGRAKKRIETETDVFIAANEAMGVFRKTEKKEKAE